MTKEEKLLEVLNKAWKLLPPVRREVFNCRMVATDQEGILALEKEYDQLGVVGKIYCSFDVQEAGYGMTTISLIATITDILVDKRLAAMWDVETDLITGWCWYNAG